MGVKWLTRRWRQELEVILESLEDADPDIKASALLRTDGLVMAAALPKGANENLIGAMSAALHNISVKAIAELECGEIDRVIVTGSKGDITIKKIAPEIVLSVITKSGANLGLVLVEIDKAAEKVNQILEQM